MELITALGLVGVCGYIVRKLYARIREDKWKNLEWEIECVQQYHKAIRYQPSCREVLAYQRATGR